MFVTSGPHRPPLIYTYYPGTPPLLNYRSITGTYINCIISKLLSMQILIVLYKRFLENCYSITCYLLIYIILCNTSVVSLKAINSRLNYVTKGNIAALQVAWCNLHDSQQWYVCCAKIKSVSARLNEDISRKDFSSQFTESIIEAYHL